MAVRSGVAIAIKLAARPAAQVVETAQDQSKIEPAFAPNELAKTDRLKLLDTPVKTEFIVPVTKPMPAESPSTIPETIKKVDIDRTVVHQAPVFESDVGRRPDRNWRNANAKINSSSRLVCILKVTIRSQAQANTRRTKRPKSGTADRTPWGVS
jgi:hypothetical protein